jgi:uncharacterized repeat protein (TIGR01451 family)
MSLNDLEKKLYDPDSGIEKRKHEESPFDPMISAQKNTDDFKKEKSWTASEDTGKAERKKIFKIGAIALGAILFIALLVVGFVKYQQSAFNNSRVTVAISGPSEVSSSNETTYKINFKNGNRAELKNAQILLNYSENFKPKESQNLKIDNPSNSRIDLGTIKSNSEGSMEISGTFLAAKDTIIYLNATLQYTPSNFNSPFQSKNQLGVNVSSSPLFLEIQAPQEVANGNKVDYVINFRNSSSEYLDGVRLKMEYPDGFSFISSDPSPSEGNAVWYLGSLSPDQSGKVVVSGSMIGSEEEGKTVKASLGYAGSNGQFIVYDQKEEITKIAPTLLSISQTINNGADSNVNAGETLRYSIQYKNSGSIGLNDVVIIEEINSRILDFSKLELDKKGAYKASQKTITWKASDIPELASLAPGAGGTITFSVPILDRIPVENSNDKNFNIVSTAKIDSPTIPNPIGSNKMVASNTVELKLNSRVALEEEGYYKDAIIENSGPIPPKVDQETSYTMHWKIINVSNDISDVKVVSSLPSGLKWLGKISPDTESVNFNERTNQIEWDAGSLKNGVGIFEPLKEISFQISVTPQANEVGNAILLLNPSVLTAKDLYTGSDIKADVGEKNNRLPEDSSIGVNYKVVQ